MAGSFCSTSGTFCRLRSVLENTLGIAAHDVHPGMPLAELVPLDKRRVVWRELRREGLALPPLVLTARHRHAGLAHVLHAVASASAWFQSGWALLTVIPFGLLGWWFTRPLAIHVNPCGPATVRDAVLYLTSFKESRRAGYPWSDDEIATKVRLILAESLGVPLERVTPEARFIEDLGCC
jgi:hypothetical protein